MNSVIIEGVKTFKKNVIEEGETSFTDTHVFDNCCIVVRAVAHVSYIVIDKETGKQIKDHHIGFALQAVDDSDEMSFVEMEED